MVGFMDPYHPGCTRGRYYQRELLDFTDADYDMIRDLLTEQLGHN